MSEYGSGFYGRGAARVDADWQNLIEGMRAKEERRAREEQQRQQREYERAQSDSEIQARIKLALMARRDPQAAAYAREHGIDIPEYVESPQEEAQRLAAEGAAHAIRENPNLYWNTPGAREAVFANIATGGHNTNESVAQEGIRGSTYRNQSVLPKEQVAARRVDDKLDLSAWEGSQEQRANRKFLEIEKPEAASRIGENRAQTVEAGVRTEEVKKRTGLLGTEPTIDKFTAARLQNMDSEIERLQKDRTDWQMKLADPDPDHKVNAALIDQAITKIESRLQELESKRELLQSGRAVSYVPPSGWLAPPKPGPRERIAQRNAAGGSTTSPSAPTPQTVAPRTPTAPVRKQINGHWYTKVNGGWQLEE